MSIFVKGLSLPTTIRLFLKKGLTHSQVSVHYFHFVCTSSSFLHMNTLVITPFPLVVYENEYPFVFNPLLYLILPILNNTLPPSLY